MTIDEIREDAVRLFNKINDSLDQQDNYSQVDLDQLCAYAFHEHKDVWRNCDQYFALAARIPTIKDHLLFLMRKGSARERWIVAQSVYPNRVGEEFCEKIVHLALLDRSAKVRLYGSMRTVSFNYRCYAQLVKEAIDLDNHPTHKKTLKTYYRYLTEDFFIEKNGDNKYTVRHYHGFFQFESDLVDEQELRQYVIDNFSHKIYQ